jgi:uncharacterized protein (TIGR03067 family)
MMKGKFAALVLAIAALMSACAHRMNGNSALYGKWGCVSAVVDGRSLPEETTKLLRLAITEHGYKTEKGGEVLFESTYTTDTSKNPRQINMVGTEGDLAGKEAQGIFAVEGDRLEICYTMPGLMRPTKFESPAGSKAYWIVWTRAR